MKKVAGIKSYTYDRFGRQLTTTATFNGSKTVTMAADTYNSIGQLSQSVTDGLAATYSYNVRGVLRSISVPGCFSQTLYYEDGSVPCRNGNISRITDTAFDHRYTYDGADRLISCTVTPVPAAAGMPDNLSTAYKYDRNSNITALTRYGETTAGGATGLVDDLTMTYEGNQLMSVSDAAAEVLLERSLDFQDGADSDAEYAYNANGALIRDDNRGITSISYNTLGLPQCVTFDNGRRIDYRYNAAGRKLAAMLRRKSLLSGGTILSGRPCITLEPDPGGTIIANPGTKPGIGTVSGSVTLDSRDYIGNCELSGDTLLRVNTPYGYFDGTDYYTYLRDYQGNIRCVVRPVGRADFAMVQQNHYYPYGLPVSCSVNPDANPYKYGSKHLDTRHGLNLYDFEARLHAPDLARFLSPDPHASDYHDLSPYIFCAANPIRNIDPTGKYFVDTKGHRIDYNPSTGQWSANATADVKRYAGYLSKTKIGTTLLNEVLNTSTAVSVTYYTEGFIENKFTIRGNTIIDGYHDTISNKSIVKNADIEISDVSVSLYSNYFQSDKAINFNDKIERLLQKMKPTKEELHIIVAIHEGIHATDNQNLFPLDNEKREQKADEIITKLIDELIKLRE